MLIQITLNWSAMIVILETIYQGVETAHFESYVYRQQSMTNACCLINIYIIIWTLVLQTIIYRLLGDTLRI